VIQLLIGWSFHSDPTRRSWIVPPVQPLDQTI
jgi:hypothetical protein